MNTKAGCTEPATRSNARGPQNLAPRAPADYDAPVVASYDQDSRALTWLPGGLADLGDAGAGSPTSPERSPGNGSTCSPCWASVTTGAPEPIEDTPRLAPRGSGWCCWSSCSC